MKQRYSVGYMACQFALPLPLTVKCTPMPLAWAFLLPTGQQIAGMSLPILKEVIFYDKNPIHNPVSPSVF